MGPHDAAARKGMVVNMSQSHTHQATHSNDSNGINEYLGRFRESFPGLGRDVDHSTANTKAELRSSSGEDGPLLPSKSRETTHSTEELLAGSFSPWAPNNSSGEMSPSQSFNSTFGFTNSGHWTSPVREKSPFIKSSGSRGPLDFHSPALSSPVSSSEDSSKAALAESRSSHGHEHASRPSTQQREVPLDAIWAPSVNKGPFVLSSAAMTGGGEETLRGNGEGEEARLRQDMQEAFQYANRRHLDPKTDITRTYSAAYLQGEGRQGHESSWYSDLHRGAAPHGRWGVEQGHDTSMRSTALDRLPLYPIHTSNGETSLYKPYQPDLRSMPQQTTTPLFSPSLDGPRLDTSAFSPPGGGAEFSIFVGDLCPELREAELVAQFLQPSAWPASHPFAIAHAHAQQAQGNYGTPGKVRPAPFASTKSAKIMTDPLTGASRGFGFVRFSQQDDCARALIEMQGMVITPTHGTGRPLRVCTATPKNRTASNTSSASALWNSQSLGEMFHLQQQLQQRPSPLKSSFAPALSSPPGYKASAQSGPIGGGSDSSAAAAAYSNSALDPNNTTVFVGGLSSLISEETLKTFFAPFGEIIYVKIPPGKGCGFVQFVQKTDAERAIERMQGFPIGGGRIRLSWGRSQGDKVAAAAAQAVAQTAQMSHLASLAELGALTPAQLSHLAGASMGASTALSINDATSLWLQRLAAAAVPPSLGRESDQHYELNRPSSFHNLPSMEYQHRQAQRLALQSDEANAGFEEYAGGDYDQARRLAQHRNDDQQLAALFPSLRLGEIDQYGRDYTFAEQPRPSPLQHQASHLGTPLPHNAGERLQRSPLENKKSHYVKQSNFSPFSPSISPSIIDDLPLPPSNEKEQTYKPRQPADTNDNPFKRYLEAERLRLQQRSPSQGTSSA